MGTFFLGWRRNLGIVTLVMALMFTGGWIRSLSVDDSINFPSGKSTFHTISSDQNDLIWMAWSGPDFVPDRFPGFYESYVPLHSNNDPFGGNHPERDWHAFGFRFAESPSDTLAFRVWMVPYWSIVLPLTLLSAWLLLTKSRSSTLKEAVESIPETMS